MGCWPLDSVVRRTLGALNPHRRRRSRHSAEIKVQRYQSPPNKRRHAHFLSVAFSSKPPVPFTGRLSQGAYLSCSSVSSA